MTIDPNDISSLTDDIEELERIANGVESDAEEAGEPESTGKTDAETEGDTSEKARSEPGDESEPEKDGEDHVRDGKAEDERERAASSEPEKGRDQREEAAEEAEDDGADVKTIDGIPVLAKDGKHVIPHDVLKKARSQARTYREENDRLSKELEQLRTNSGESKQETPKAEPQFDPESEAVKTKYEKYKEEWGEDFADTWLQTQKLTADLNAEREARSELEAQIRSQADTTAERESREKQDAIDNSPLMAAWQADDESDYWDRAVELHQYLMRTDSDYADADWGERFSRLPEKVEAVHGKSPHRASLPSLGTNKTQPAKQKPQVDENEVKKRAQEKLSEAGEQVPKSLSEVGGGGEPAQKSEVEKVEDMSPVEMQAYFDKLADDPDALSMYLASLG